MGQLRLVWFIALKDLKLFTRDRMALFFFVLFPFMFIVLFNFLMSGVGAEDDRLVFHLVTLEEETETALSHQIIAAIETPDDSSLRPGEPVFIREDDYDELRRQVEDKELSGFLAFPEDFTESVFMGGGAEIEVVADPEAVLRRVCRFLGEAFAPRMLGFHETAGQKIPGHRQAWHARTTAPVTDESVGRWRTALSGRDRALFQRVAGAGLGELGYPLESASPAARLASLPAWAAWRARRAVGRLRGRAP